MFFVDGIHDPVAQFIGDNDDDDFLLGLKRDTMIGFQCFHTAPSGPEDCAASRAQISGSIQYVFGVTLIDADKDQGVAVLRGHGWFFLSCVFLPGGKCLFQQGVSEPGSRLFFRSLKGEC